MSANVRFHRILLIVLCLFAQLALAQTQPPNSNEDPARIESADNTVVQLNILPSDIEDEPSFEFEKLTSLLVDEQNSEIIPPSDSTDWLSQLPLSPHIEESLTGTSLQKFLRIRKIILYSAAKIVRLTARNPTSFLQKLSALDQYVQKSSGALANSNRTGITVSLSFSFGVGLSEKARNKILVSRMGRWISKFHGFYYAVAVGGGLYKEVRGDGTQSLLIQPFVDFDRLLKVHTYLVQTSAAINYAVVAENQNGTFTNVLETTNAGIMGSFKQSDQYFSYGLATGASIPPGLPATMVYSATTKRFSSPLVLRVPWLRQQATKSCSGALDP